MVNWDRLEQMPLHERIFGRLKEALMAGEFGPGERLLGVSTFRDWGVVAYRRGGLARLGMLDYGTGDVSEIAFDEPLYSVGTG